MTEVRKSNCHHCGYLCGVEVHVDERERIQKIILDPTRYPYDTKIVKRFLTKHFTTWLIVVPTSMSISMTVTGSFSRWNTTA